MKETLLACLFMTASLTALAQGKVNLINDAASLVTPLPPPASGITLMAGLYGGTSSSGLFLYSTVLLNDQSLPPGYIPGTHIVLSAQPNGAPLINGIANGTAIGATTPWFQVRVWDSAYASFEGAMASGSYWLLWGPEFQFNPGPSLNYPNTAPPGVNSTWSETPITTPEPSTLALVGLGAATLLIFRCRK